MMPLLLIGGFLAGAVVLSLTVDALRPRSAAVEARTRRVDNMMAAEEPPHEEDSER
jgi:hypothetical protein